MSDSGQNQKVDLVVVLNVPTTFNTGDLRRFFTDFVETEKFCMFHYKRRPLKHLLKQAQDNSGKAPEIARKIHNCIQNQNLDLFKDTNLALATVFPVNVRDFLDKYKSRLWMGQDQEELDTRCHVVHVPLDKIDELMVLREFSGGGGSLCPRGNVGTPSRVLKEAVRQCRMPSKMIGKLGIGPSSGLRYAAVAPPAIEPDNPRGRVLQSDSGGSYIGPPDIMAGAPPGPPPVSPVSNDMQQRPLVSTLPDKPVADDDLGEEWDRHDCLHDDVNARRQLPRDVTFSSDWADNLEHQPGTKERLFEEKMEVTWDKGSSGLVFYTDAQFWHAQQASEDRNTDDWDVDTSIYYGGTDPDRDSREMREMGQSTSEARNASVFTRKIKSNSEHGMAKKVQHRAETKSFKADLYKNFKKPVAANKNTVKTSGPNFSEQSKGHMGANSKVDFKAKVGKKRKPEPKFAGNSFSRKVMAKQGYKAGQGLGAASSGITDPVDTRGQMTRAGLGYVDGETANEWTGHVAKPSTSSK